VRCRVVTWNIHSCLGADGRYDPRRTADVLEALDADVIGLQEVDWRSPPHRDVDQFTFLASELGMRSIAGPNLEDHLGAYGNGLLTKLPIVEHECVRFEAHAGKEPRGAIIARLDLGGRFVDVYVTHLGLTRGERRAQIRALKRSIAARRSTARVLLGDINEWGHRLFVRRAFTPRPFARMLTGRTFPSRLPIFCLDWVFVDPAPRSHSVHIVRTREARSASDHLPLVVDLEWS
jgi:endonuclease/exonuclease/phosphatase family metal-dependent hydrolase